jgi:hypothetical protein
MEIPPKPPFQSALEDHPEYARAIGMISVEIANLEIMLGDLLGALLHIDYRIGEIVYLTPKSAIGRIAILDNVLEASLATDSKQRKHIETMLSKAKKYIGKRHDVIHGAWGVNSENRQQVVSANLPLSDEIEGIKTVQLSDLTDLLKSIRILATEVHGETAKIYADWLPYTSHNRFYEQPPVSTGGSENPRSDDPVKR